MTETPNAGIRKRESNSSPVRVPPTQGEACAQALPASTAICGSSDDEKRREGQMHCACCLLPIEKGDMIVIMPCCSAWCHISCIGRLANAHRSFMRHACPKCLRDLTEEEEQTYIKLWNVIRRK